MLLKLFWQHMKEVPELVHASNSATTLGMQRLFSMRFVWGDRMVSTKVRGSELAFMTLTPALTLESALVHVKTVPAGELAYSEPPIRRIASVCRDQSTGYADGWTRDMQEFLSW